MIATLHVITRNVMTVIYVLYMLPYLLFLYWLASMYIIRPAEVQYDLFGRQISNTFSLSYFGESVSLDGMHYEWEYDISRSEYSKFKTQPCDVKLLPRLGRSGYYSFPYCRVYSKSYPLPTKNSQFIKEAYVPLDRSAIRLVYDRGQI
jgi:hypothetical protein